MMENVSKTDLHATSSGSAMGYIFLLLDFLGNY